MRIFTFIQLFVILTKEGSPQEAPSSYLPIFVELLVEIPRSSEWQIIMSITYSMC